MAVINKFGCMLFFRIEPVITKEDTHMRPAIPAKIRLLVTLRYLSGPASFGVLEDIFRIPKTTLSRIIPSVCDALWDQLHEDFIILPQTKEDWDKKSKEFLHLWQYPFALGALDGKHVEVQAFSNSGSLFYNYKGKFSIVLFALVDANYNFLYLDIGKPGSTNDAMVWQDSSLKKALDSGKLNFPDPVGNIQYHLVRNSCTIQGPLPTSCYICLILS